MTPSFLGQLIENLDKLGVVAVLALIILAWQKRHLFSAGYVAEMRERHEQLIAAKDQTINALIDTVAEKDATIQRVLESRNFWQEKATDVIGSWIKLLEDANARHRRR